MGQQRNSLFLLDMNMKRNKKRYYTSLQSTKSIFLPTRFKSLIAVCFVAMFNGLPGTFIVPSLTLNISSIFGPRLALILFVWVNSIVPYLVSNSP